MTRDRGYPDWLVLSARLLWAGYNSAKYIYVLSCSPCGYVKILQPVAICTVIFVTLDHKANYFKRSVALRLYISFIFQSIFPFILAKVMQK